MREPIGTKWRRHRLFQRNHQDVIKFQHNKLGSLYG
jgi:hypothetical protein